MLDIYFTENVANIIRSVRTAGSGALMFADTELKSGEVRGVSINETVAHISFYQRGFDAALGAVAAAFGILPEIKS